MLRTLLCCVIFLSAAVVFIDAQEYAEGTILEDDVSSFTCSQAGPQCASDCTTLMLCAADVAEPFANVSCPMVSPSTPYCLGNICSASPGNCTTAASFRCTNVGVYPDPTDCTRYRYCNESGGESEIYVCPTGFVFNSKINICQKGASHKASKHNHFCNTIDCTKKSNEIVLYKPNPAYYAFCFVGADGIRETIMYKCDYEQYQVFDPTLNTCKYNCKKPGYYQDPGNCSSYYVCSGRGGGIKAEQIDCPSSYYFDGSSCSKDSSNCLPGSLDSMSSGTV